MEWNFVDNCMGFGDGKRTVFARCTKLRGRGIAKYFKLQPSTYASSGPFGGGLRNWECHPSFNGKEDDHPECHQVIQFIVMLFPSTSVSTIITSVSSILRSYETSVCLHYYNQV